MAEYMVPESREPIARRNEQSKIETAEKAKTFTEAEVLALLSKAQEVNDGRE